MTLISLLRRVQADQASPDHAMRITSARHTSSDGCRMSTNRRMSFSHVRTLYIASVGYLYLQQSLLLPFFMYVVCVQYSRINEISPHIIPIISEPHCVSIATADAAPPISSPNAWVVSMMVCAILLQPCLFDLDLHDIQRCLEERRR